MTPEDRNDKIDAMRRPILMRQHDYFKYLYEQELERATKIVNGGRVYIAILVFFLGSMFLQIVPFAKIGRLLQTSFMLPPHVRILAITLMACSVVTLALALIFSMLIFSTWNYERLCDPKRRLFETLAMSDELEVFSRAIADFTVATDRNFTVNNRRTTCLTLAFFLLLFAILFTLATASYLNVAL